MNGPVEEFAAERRSGAEHETRDDRERHDLERLWFDRLVRQIGGIDHVGIGTDFDGIGCAPPDIDSYNKFPALTRALLEKGYSAQDIKKIYGGNLLRVMRAVEKRAQELKGEPPIETTLETAK